ncbi:MAG TPA: hypothetical protein PLT63_01215 [Syntrophales bacterium]|jgi:hypothetical protein|nr:hypothetical protein [Syntrophales bacterium]HPL66186.1 hypothetical protein [Smithellaceae bacterium]
MTKMHQVRKEFGEPFRDVVKGFAIMGYSRKATAEFVEITDSWFNELCERFDLRKHFRRQRKDFVSVCKPPGHPKGKTIRQPQRYSDEYLLAVLRGYSKRISQVRFNQLQGGRPCADTYLKRFGSWRKARELAAKCEDERERNGENYG